MEPGVRAARERMPVRRGNRRVGTPLDAYPVRYPVRDGRMPGMWRVEFHSVSENCYTFRSRPRRRASPWIAEGFSPTARGAYGGRSSAAPVQGARERSAPHGL